LAKANPGEVSIATSGIGQSWEAGYDVHWESTQILIAPPNLPAAIGGELAKAFETAVNEPEYKKFIIERNVVPFYQPPDQAVSFFDEQRKVARAVMEKAGILKEKK
jgi:tripartite-type tricarboxylate transporter receptor subunit TctC